MSWFSGLVGGGIGLMVAGPFGAVIGAAIGSSMGKGNGQMQAGYGRSTGFSSAQQNQVLFFTAAFSMVGKLAKADGRICDDEIAAIRRVANDAMGLDEQTRQYAINILNQSKTTPESFGDYAREFGKLFRQDQNMCSFMMSFLFEVAMADGELHSSEEKMLLEAKQHFGLHDSVYQSLYSRFVGKVQASPMSMAKHYEVLGVEHGATASEVKKAYRQKASEFHPDKIEGKGLPPEFIKFANDKLAEINASYDEVKKAQKIN